ncbi:MAG: gliding motility-associated ABC transporter ATP-binding subunit GldA [Cyclobacteriaceae bacterium]|nr:gliding motility-associated ABC transporter ATP-binding subunit GldA [Cyclobacteriaceae bacterium]
MSIKVSNLTKQYGSQKAVDQISFSVNEGEIVGFLGPNGAGKSTTMKIMTGFLPPTLGTVEVGGKNVMDYPMDVKQMTGYLPEHNPLYLDMYVHEYLTFMAGIYGLKSSSRKDRVIEMVGLCGLNEEQNKRIGMLSKGYRQRVGLAQALIHNPKVLVLDEPTSGLDPNQLIEIRNLIKTISKNKTVLFSTHILQEVEALCDRVIVINKGHIVADDRLENLLQGGGNYLIVEFANQISRDELMLVKGVEQVEHIENFKFRIRSQAGSDIRPLLVSLAVEKNLSLIGLKKEENSLESIFGQLTTSEEKKQPA